MLSLDYLETKINNECKLISNQRLYENTFHGLIQKQKDPNDTTWLL